MTELRKRNPNSSSKPPQSKTTKVIKNANNKVEADQTNSGENSDICGNILKILMFVIVVPPMLNYAGLKQEKEYLMKNISLYDVGFGQKLFMSCLGEGRPTVILDSPTGMTSDVWTRGQLELAEVTRVCSYDRAGLGWSDPPPSLNMSDPGEAAVGRTLGPEGTVVRMAHDLHRLVTFAYPQERPFVLVGVELGAMVARVYSQLHPQDVAHLVMIDPLSETLFDDVSNVNDADKTENPWLGYWYGHVLSTLRMLQVAAMVGLARLGLVTGLMKTPMVGASESDQEERIIKLKHHLCDPFHIQVIGDVFKVLWLS